jgi:hypothetical protein
MKWQQVEQSGARILYSGRQNNSGESMSELGYLSVVRGGSAGHLKRLSLLCNYKDNVNTFPVRIDTICVLGG